MDDELWSNVRRVCDVVGHDKMLITIVGPMTVMPTADDQPERVNHPTLHGKHLECALYKQFDAAQAIGKPSLRTDLTLDQISAEAESIIRTMSSAAGPAA